MSKISTIEKITIFRDKMLVFQDSKFSIIFLSTLVLCFLDFYIEDYLERTIEFFLFELTEELLITGGWSELGVKMTQYVREGLKMKIQKCENS